MIIQRGIKMHFHSSMAMKYCNVNLLLNFTYREEVRVFLDTVDTE